MLFGFRVLFLLSALVVVASFRDGTDIYKFIAATVEAESKRNTIFLLGKVEENSKLLTQKIDKNIETTERNNNFLMQKMDKNMETMELKLNANSQKMELKLDANSQKMELKLDAISQKMDKYMETMELKLNTNSDKMDTVSVRLNSVENFIQVFVLGFSAISEYIAKIFGHDFAKEVIFKRRT